MTVRLVAYTGPDAVALVDNGYWRNNIWTAADCGATVVDRAGRILQFMGDTYTDGAVDRADPTGWDSSGGFTNNSLIWSAGGQIGAKFSITPGVNIFGGPLPYVSNPVGGFRWPQSAFVAPGGTIRAVYCGFLGSIFTSYTPDKFLEVLIGDDLELQSVTERSALNPSEITSRQVYWGKTVLYSGGYIYIFGIWLYDGGGGFTWQRPILARIPAASGLGGTPTFWDGATWNASQSAIAELGAVDVGSQYTVLPHPSGGWALISFYRGIWSHDIRMWTATALTGPWTDRGVIFTADTSLFTGAYNYGGFCHWDRNDGALWIGYNLNGPPGNTASYLNYGLRWTRIERASLPY